MILFRHFSSLILFVISLDFINCDYFSSVTGLENLLVVEAHYLESLESHIQEVEKFNKEIQSFLDEVEFEQLKIQNDTTAYFEDPINAFKAIKRFTVDWNQMEDFTQQIQAISVYNELSSLLPTNITLPTVNDLNGASQGLARLQHIYKLNSKDIAEGQLGTNLVNTKLVSSDCFVLGQRLYESKDYQYASEWLIEALQKLEDEESYGLEEYEYESDHEQEDNEANNQHEIGNNSEQSKYGKTETNNEETALYPYVSNIEILEFLAPALYNAGNRKLAMIMNNKLLAMDQEHQYGLSNKNLFESVMKKERRLRLLKKTPDDINLDRLYAQVCNGEIQQSPREKRNLRCRYVTNNVPYYFVGPIKMEELNSEPFIAFYHQIISDNEIDQILDAAVESLERSSVKTRGNSMIADARISKGSWLYREDHPFMHKISKRLEDITGLSIESGEALQVANYGIGGQYGPHMDASEVPDIDFPGMGNRILTALFFINKVDLGGATAFPILRLAVPPLRNNLLVWYNLHKSGEMDYSTIHAGCPVIKGSKWIANQWFHSIGQEFKRLCATTPDDDDSKLHEFVLELEE